MNDEYIINQYILTEISYILPIISVDVIAMIDINPIGTAIQYREQIKINTRNDEIINVTSIIFQYSNAQQYKYSII